MIREKIDESCPMVGYRQNVTDRAAVHLKMFTTLLLYRSSNAEKLSLKVARSSLGGG